MRPFQNASRLLPSTLFAACLMGTPAHAEQRCGWLQNPSPGNWWLADRDGEWEIMLQGGQAAPGWDDLPDLTRNWGSTNGRPYKYGCACLEVAVNRETKRVVRVWSGRALPRATCQNDAALRGRRPD